MTKNSISKDLQNTVIANDHIDAVHFTAAGHHYFNVHEHKGDKYGQIAETTILDKNSKQIKVKTPMLSTKIVESVLREEVCNCEAVEESPIVDSNGVKVKKGKK